MTEHVSSLKTGIKYKDTPIGKIPVDWEVVRLEDVSEISMGQSPPSEVCSEEAKGLPFYQGNAEFGSKYPSPQKWCEKPKKIAIQGDILISVRAPVGEINIAPHKCCIGRGLAAITARGINPDYLYHSLFIHRKALQKIAQGSTFEAINSKELSDLSIFSPPFSEQKKVAEILTTVDEAIEKTDQIIEKTKEVKKGLMQKLLIRGIGHKKFKKTEIGEIPEEWEVIKLGTLTETITKGTTPTTYGFNFTESGINFVKVESIDEYGNFIWENIPHISEEANKALNRSILSESDILFSIAGALGRVAIVNKDLLPANTNQALAIIRLKKNGIAIVGYLKCYLMGPIIQGYIERIAVQSAQANLSLKQVNDLLLSLPPLHEQKQIADILFSIDEEIEKESNHKEQFESLKKGLMQVLLTGKIRVSV